MSKSSKKRKEVQVESTPNEEFACPVCGRLSVDPSGCPQHKSEE